jgi:hypothetical protein
MTDALASRTALITGAGQRRGHRRFTQIPGRDRHPPQAELTSARIAAHGQARIQMIDRRQPPPTPDRLSGPASAVDTAEPVTDTHDRARSRRRPRLRQLGRPACVATPTRPRCRAERCPHCWPGIRTSHRASVSLPCGPRVTLSTAATPRATWSAPWSHIRYSCTPTTRSRWSVSLRSATGSGPVDDAC